MSEWKPIALADKSKIYDLAISDGKGWRDRVTNCFWRNGGRHGKAGWWTVNDHEYEPCPVIFLEREIKITHFLEIPNIPE